MSELITGQWHAKHLSLFVPMSALQRLAKYWTLKPAQDKTDESEISQNAPSPDGNLPPVVSPGQRRKRSQNQRHSGPFHPRSSGLRKLEKNRG
ncbi:hypothetical protein [Verrucomicrobium sp. BvORR106]|uniref:hypothetical protein n=1 Tax=Verrucomicrobium sp. BvORR106 TaxID=1403819 RepID=UPI002240F1B3|nr:hypothetical protein [Verrucomicrobium sp. BvORR106]